jgi:L-fuconolactonase
MPDFPIVDTHLHLWDPQNLSYPWLAAVPSLNRAYLLPEYRTACAPVAVEKLVFLQCECDPTQYRQEADWVTGLAREDPRIVGIVPWAPLEQGQAVAPELERLRSNPLVKGIRRIIQFEPDPAFCLRPAFVEGVRLLADCELHFEICIKGDEQFRNALTLVQNCPRTRFILNHIGKPFIKERILEPWASMLRDLAGRPNTVCKMSGLVTEADHTHWRKEDLKPYIDHVIACFGFERTLFGGDWPVALQAAGYANWVETLEWALRGASREQLTRLFRDNAIDFYRLPT